jgi:hypothetical protein
MLTRATAASVISLLAAVSLLSCQSAEQLSSSAAGETKTHGTYGLKRAYGNRHWLSSLRVLDRTLGGIIQRYWTCWIPKFSTA